ncbi:hypothetical protein ACFQ4L_06830 [Lapidilactobacillus mulanensis]|uniref:Toxin-antitoxin system n=1 Tax=Lapidilactobacillus mulanensis TaxID=2485999 RepID=A0ABW4DPX7_9LACO|nr:hypothetical protein [Lapidilactobacillus mulanensis]
MSTTVKARKQGNSMTLTVPSSFKIAEGTAVRPRMTSKGIFYEFIDEDEFLDFDEDILKDILREDIDKGQILTEFKIRKDKIADAFDQIEQETPDRSITRESLAQDIGL